MDELAWFYALGGERRGPISHRELLAGIVEGRIPLTALIWRQGFETWMTISDVRNDELPELADMLPPPIPAGVRAVASGSLGQQRPDPRTRSPSEPFHRLEILMELDKGSWYQCGIPKQAAVRSTLLRPVPISWDGGHALIGHVIACLLLCGRILIIRKETREELAAALRDATARCLLQTTPKFSLAEWHLVTEASEYQLWPWPIVPPDELRNPVRFLAEVFMAEVRGQPFYTLDLQMGGRLRDGRILAPSSAAIAVQSAADALVAAGHPLVLPLLIKGFDDHFFEGGYSIGGEAYALQRAFQFINQEASKLRDRRS